MSSSTDSLWLARAPSTAYRALDRDADFDVAVIGGGIAGISAALALKRDGLRVAVLERGAVCGGATGMTTAKVSALQETKLSEIRKLHGADGARAYASASLEAVGEIDRLVRELLLDCGWERVAAYTYAADDSQLDAVRAEADGARDAGLEVSLVDHVPLPFAVPLAVRLDDQGQLDPVRYVRGLAAAVDGDGSRIFESTAVADVTEGEPCRVTALDGATITARDVVVATNYPLLDRGAFFARTEAARSYLIAARLRKSGAPDGMFITAGTPSRSLRTYVDGDDTWLLVGGEGHLVGSEEAQPERYEALERFAREHFDVSDVPYRWSTQDAMPADKLPYIGAYTPGSDHLFVAAGFQKWGMTSATIAARMLADRVAGRENPYVDVFDPNRVSVRAAPKLVSTGWWTAKHMIGDRLSTADTHSVDDVPAGEARVLRSGLGKIGVYRDDAGTTHGVSLRCTHLGCLLHFNDAERSWDCPCHGSRFGIDGAVLAGPALHALERHDVT
jgi:glycine/D-amino acid oxidase-like deaminating enzyme/nitrite reductase/ring-hydroxylating ferredoxin subunit